MTKEIQSPKLVVSIASRALFNLDEGHQVYENEGVDAYCQYQIKHENDPLEPGIAFALVKKLLALNTQQPLVEVTLLSRNSADTGLRIFNSIAHHKLDITRAVFTSGTSPYQYLAGLGAHLFLSADKEDVTNALENYCAAALILPSTQTAKPSHQLRIAFDGDAVLFSDESERIYQEQGLAAFNSNEQQQAQTPLAGGPFKGFLSALHHLQRLFPADQCPIRTALITARGAPAHERVIRTLRKWNIRIDEALFLGGLSKGQFLKAFAADFFFDDQRAHCDSARKHVATGQVPSGVVAD